VLGEISTILLITFLAKFSSKFFELLLLQNVTKRRNTIYSIVIILACHRGYIGYLVWGGEEIFPPILYIFTSVMTNIYDSSIMRLKHLSSLVLHLFKDSLKHAIFKHLKILSYGTIICRQLRSN